MESIFEVAGAAASAAATLPLAASPSTALPDAMSAVAWVRIAVESSCATLAGTFQVALSCLEPWMAAHVLLATTATALTAPCVIAPRDCAAVMGTTASAPEGTAGVRASVAPNAGACLIAANTMPGRRTSSP